MAIADGIAEYHVFGVQIRGARSSAFFEIWPKLSMVEHDQDFICAIITAETSGEYKATVGVCPKTVKKWC